MGYLGFLLRYYYTPGRNKRYICFAAIDTVLAHCAVLGTCLNAFFVLGSPALQKSPTKVPQQGADANALAHLGGVANNPVLNRSYA